ncbi:DUF4249 domain-containing protein [Adhaeribacter radiodurans]|uniref:DUF4249 domain-containing protein n=1 Tax=Adhaeribacter radiodurans TaxID=2745197 RepID=A0A7L7L8L2_9BACT|nr:DUF4249 domain-containing protein [Adhaeribacter radiodurans]QMU28739.1 DUF4249 domain-containing protein [Adhaeribacter radiodurans]
MKNFVFFFFSFLMLALTSCETVVDLDLKQSEPKLAVEAIITDQANQNTVKLTLSAPYAKNVEPTPVNDAQVIITDNAGNTIPFIHETNGLYKPATDFKGVIGRSYTLTILANGQSYTATSVLNSVPTLDKVTYEYVDGKNDDYGREEGYYISTAFQDIAGVKNYYKLYVVVNGQLRQQQSSDILVTEDKLYDGSYLDDLQLFTAFAQNDQLEVNLLSLTKEAYDFYAAMSDLANQGGLMGRNPANLPTNISNGAVGFFSTSAISSKSLVIE